jgi:hypothetical protein
MNESRVPAMPAAISTRRHVLAGMAIALGGAVVRSEAWGQTPPTMHETPSTGANLTRTSLHQEIEFTAAPQRLYRALLTSKQFTAFSGLPAKSTPRRAAVFPCSGG